MEPKAKRDSGQTVVARTSGKNKQLAFGTVITTKPMGRPRKMEGERYRRLSLMVEPRIDQAVRQLADERFLGNLSKAVAFSVELTVLVLNGPAMRDRRLTTPADALAVAGVDKPTATGRRP